ncbi:hypothetical protein KFE25_007603 [Diacronema lutheri]|uniref:Protein kinase domain-containing protein n=1 Tax=Diacronema lutheri TaxID=2081491 RepID=A0A8J6CGG4_DIALT|nr:hypothetical protein KFE25_007603 [Diacronema lutheri]
MAEEDIASLLLRLEPSVSPFAALERLDLRNAGLAALPLALPVCAQLSQLDVSSNRALASLAGVDALVHLRVLFATGCGLGPALPAGGPLSRCPCLYMLSLKENGLRVLDGDALPATLGWLIAAQNEIDEVRAPHRLQRVRKLMLSHNRLTTDALEPLVDAAVGLEMLRVACNRLDAVPRAARGHPSLAWLALGGNPYAQRQLDVRDAVEASGGSADVAPLLVMSDVPDLRIGDAVLGRGSGATVREGALRGEPVAVKLWTAELFSDGDARGECAIGRLTSACPDVVRTLAVFQQPQLGMVLELLHGASAASGPPTFASVTRDALDVAKDRLTPAEALRVAVAVGSACAWCHARGILHGDVYLHNTLIARADGADGADGGTPGAISAVRLSDFGASTAYDRAADGEVLERIEARAFGILLADLVALCAAPSDASADDGVGARVRAALTDLADLCGQAELLQVPRFEQLVRALRAVELDGLQPVFRKEV